MHLAYPVVEAINRPALHGTGTNMQNIEMLKLNNLLDANYNHGNMLLQNPMAQFLPASMKTTQTNHDAYSFALGGSAKKVQKMKK